MEEMYNNQSETKTFSRISTDHHHIPDEIDFVTVRRNNLSSRVSARPPFVTTRARSDPNSGYFYDEGSVSTSSMSATPSPVLRKSFTGNRRMPSYMNPTESIKAKQRRGSNIQQKQMTSNGDLVSSSCSDPSSSDCIGKDLYPVD